MADEEPKVEKAVRKPARNAMRPKPEPRDEGDDD